MKKMLTLCFVTALLAGCGASSHVSSQDAIDIGYGTQDKDHVTTSVSNLKVKKTDAQTYSNMYDYLRGRVPGVMVGSDNRIIIRASIPRMSSPWMSSRTVPPPSTACGAPTA